MHAARIILVFIISSISGLYLQAQSVNHIQLIPSEPTSNDTISVISDFSYYGACEYGLVYSYTYSTDTSIQIDPTYCGYFLLDSTLCNRIDTFKIGPFAGGTYNLGIDYHQGSICPISDFDATIAEFDTSITISGTNSISKTGILSQLRIYPNPADGIVTIEMTNSNLLVRYQCVITNSIGQLVLQDEMDDTVLHLNTSSMSGLYFLYVRDEIGYTIALEKLLIH